MAQPILKTFYLQLVQSKKTTRKTLQLFSFFAGDSFQIVKRLVYMHTKRHVLLFVCIAIKKEVEWIMSTCGKNGLISADMCDGFSRAKVSCLYTVFGWIPNTKNACLPKLFYKLNQQTNKIKKTLQASFIIPHYKDISGRGRERKKC